MSVTLNVASPSPRLAARRSAVHTIASARTSPRIVADLVALTKPRIVLMVLVTTIVGYYVALAGPPDWTRVMHLMLGTALAAGGTLALNQYLERDVDGLMTRTRRRPLPAGRLLPLEALVFGVLAAVAGTVYLAAAVGAPAALVAGTTSVLYLFVYTPLKRRTPFCTLVGAVPGALPPLIGWLAARDSLDVGAWALFAIVFFWQVPHTLPIGRLYREDYARAGIRILPVLDPHGTSTERGIIAGAVAVTAASLVPTIVGIAGALYVVGAAIAGVALVALSTRLLVAPSARVARVVLLASLLYLPVVLALLVLDKI